MKAASDRREVANTSSLQPLLPRTDTTIGGSLPITGFRQFHPDPNINYQLNRFLIFGLEELFVTLGSRIKDFQDWKSEFLSAAKSFEERGELAQAAGLYRAAEFFMSPGDPDRRRAFETFIGLFYNTHEDRRLVRIAIPYEGGHLYGLRLAPEASSRGTIVVHAGFDAYVEEFYGLAQAMASQGYEVIMFDGPGQGSTLMRENIPLTPDWERPVGAVLDHLELTEVTLIGISLGGCLALRAAAFEPRIRRVVAFDVMLDFFQCVTSRRGRAVEILMTTLVRLRLWPILNIVARGMIKRDLYARWGIEQGMHVLGAATPAEYFLKLKAYTTRPISGRITQDVLIMAGAEDHFVPLAQLIDQLPLLTKARSVTAHIFTRADQAQSHCQIGNLGLAVTRMLSWVDGHP